MMYLGDFSSVVQLGVGLHAGSALLESVVELAGTPLTRRLSRLSRIAEKRSKRDQDFAHLHESALDLLGDLEVTKVQFFNEYKLLLQVTTGIAIGLAVLLVWLAFHAQDECPVWAGLFFCFLSMVPAPSMLAYLWSRWKIQTAALTASVDSLGRQLLGG